MSFPNRRAIRRGTHFQNGKLYLTTKQVVTVVKGWPEMRAWRKTAAGPEWVSVRPEIQIKPAWVQSGRTARRGSPRLEMPDQIRRLDAQARSRYYRRDETVKPERAVAQAAYCERCEQADEAEAEALGSFFSSIPVHVRGRVGEFPSRQWHMAVLLLRCPGAWDLVRANPALAFCLASNWAFRSPKPTQPLRDARHWICRRQRDIAGWLGFPATERTVNLLRKIPPDACDLTTLLRFRRVLRQTPVADTLSHLPRLTATVLCVVTDPRLRPLVSPRLLRELSDSIVAWGVVSDRVSMLRDTLAMAAALVPPRPSPVFTSLAQLTRHHDQLADELNLRAPPAQRRRPGAHHDQLADGLILGAPPAQEPVEMPPPPISGTETIVPLTTPAMLAEEGREQRNCVAIYAPFVAHGNEYIYRVLAPERATLQILRTPQGWRVGELSGPRNRPVSPATRIAVEQWIIGDTRVASAMNELADTQVSVPQQIGGDDRDKDWSPF